MKRANFEKSRTLWGKFCGLFWETEILHASLKCWYTDTYSMRRKQQKLKICCYRAAIQFRSQRSSEVAHMTGVLPWMDQNSSRTLQQEDEEGELPCTWVQCGCLELSVGWRRSQLKVYGSGLAGRPRGDIIVSVWYRLPFQEVDNFRQLKPGPWGYLSLQRVLAASNCGFVLHSAF